MVRGERISSRCGCRIGRCLRGPGPGGEAGKPGFDTRQDKSGEHDMKRLGKVLLWAVVGAGCAGLWLSGQSHLAADDPKVAVKERATLEGNNLNGLSVAFSPDGKTLASGTGNIMTPGGEIKLWDVAKGKEQVTLKLADTIGVLSVA